MQYQLLPTLSNDEYVALKDDIRERGVMVPIEFDERGNILDGHHRMMICNELGIKDYPSFVRVGMTEDQKIQHVLSLNLNRRHLNVDQRKNLEAELFARGWSLRRIADAVKVSHVTVKNDIDSGVKNLTPESSRRTEGKDGKSYPATRKPKTVVNKNRRDQQRTFSALADTPAEQIPDGISDSKTSKKIAENYRKQTEREATSEFDGELPICASVIAGDFREIMAGLPDCSVDMIFTDPPYGRESVPLYGDMAKHAARVLKPGGSLIAYVGHYAIGDIYNLMAEHLRYWWLIAIQHGGQSARLNGKNVIVEWKPLLWFVKDRRGNNEYVADLFKSNQPDKEAHDWQQDTSEAEYYIDLLTLPGDTVLDPFCGSGTTLLAAMNIGRKAIGIEIDHGRANVAANRVTNYTRDREPQEPREQSR